jgi:hypothetical protein
MARPVHPDKDIEAAVSFAEDKGWRYVAQVAMRGDGYSVPAAGRAIALSRYGQPPKTRLHMLARSAGE